MNLDVRGQFKVEVEEVETITESQLGGPHWEETAGNERGHHGSQTTHGLLVLMSA